MAANSISPTSLQKKWKGRDEWLSDGGGRGAGRLVAKRASAGVTFYFAYFDEERRRRFFPIGPYSPDGKRGLTLQGARDEAARLSAQYRAGTVDLHAFYEAKSRSEARARKADEDAARQAEEAAQRTSLKKLTEAYVGHLSGQAKQSAREAENIFRRHVLDAWPDLSERRAAELTTDDFVPVIAKVVEAKKGRTAAKLRSYLRAAYALAIKAKTKPNAPMALRTFGVTTNPIASIDAMPEFNRALDRVLSEDEMRAFLSRMDAMPAGVQKDALHLCLLLGGQRPTQLLRLAAKDVDIGAKTLTLYDGKGRRTQPRAHLLPLPEKALEIVTRLHEMHDEAETLFAPDGKPLDLWKISSTVTQIAVEMKKAKEIKQPFTLRDIRRTCETLLSAMGVTSDVRAQLLSHGLGGVQNRHYDKHEYMDEKRRALEALEQRLDEIRASADTKGKVVTAAFGVRARK
jgi:integrase